MMLTGMTAKAPEGSSRLVYDLIKADKGCSGLELALPFAAPKDSGPSLGSTPSGSTPQEAPVGAHPPLCCPPHPVPTWQAGSRLSGVQVWPVSTPKSLNSLPSQAGLKPLIRSQSPSQLQGDAPTSEGPWAEKEARQSNGKTTEMSMETEIERREMETERQRDRDGDRD